MVGKKQFTQEHQITTELCFTQVKKAPETGEDTNQKELALNNKQFQKFRFSMQNMRDEIKLCKTVLQKELGNDVDIHTMLRSGCGSGSQKRVQELMTLRLKLTAMKSKFLEPSHKLYYLGPFDPRKKFDLELLPQKQENLYAQLLEEDKMRFLQQGKPLEELKEQLCDLCLMHKASISRTRSLSEKIKAITNSIQRRKIEVADNARIIEYLISHQNLMKLMLDPQTLQLDPMLRSIKTDQLSNEASNLYKYKTLFEQSEKENSDFREGICSLMEKLDANHKYLIDAERLYVENRCQVENLKCANSSERKDDKRKPARKGEEIGTSKETTSLLALIIKENKRLREFLLSSVLSRKEDFNAFVTTIKNITTAFINEFEDIKTNVASLK